MIPLLWRLPLLCYFFSSPLAVYYLAPFLRPVTGPLVSEEINQVTWVSVQWTNFPEGGTPLSSSWAGVGTNYQPPIRAPA